MIKNTRTQTGGFKSEIIVLNADYRPSTSFGTLRGILSKAKGESNANLRKFYYINYYLRLSVCNLRESALKIEQ